jgi:hypothetical protein
MQANWWWLRGSSKYHNMVVLVVRVPAEARVTHGGVVLLLTCPCGWSSSCGHPCQPTLPALQQQQQYLLCQLLLRVLG